MTRIHQEAQRPILPHEAPNAPPLDGPRCVAKMSSLNVLEREEGCLDVAQLALSPVHHSVLYDAGAHHCAVRLIADMSPSITAAAAAAVRNLLLCGSGLFEQDVMGDVLCATVASQLVQTHERLKNLPRGAAPCDDVDDEEGPQVELEQLKGSVDELLQLSSVVVDLNDDATRLWSSNGHLLSVLFQCTLSNDICSDEHVATTAIYAAEVLRCMSSENTSLLEYVSTACSTEQVAALNMMSSSVPLSPRLLRLAMEVCGMMLSLFPTIENVSRVMHVMDAGMKVLPVAEWRRVLPLIVEGCTVDEQVRVASIQQTQDRFKSLQGSLSLLTLSFSVVCEANREDADDETAFAQNPGFLVLSPTIVWLLSLLEDLFSAPQDVVVHQSLREAATDNVEVTSLQQSFLACEVGILSNTSSVLHLLPLSRLGDPNAMWTTVVLAVANRVSCIKEWLDEGPSTVGHLDSMQLQVESLMEMGWTLLRKDKQHGLIRPVPERDLDLFSRLGWESFTTPQCRQFTVSVLGNLAVLFRSVAAVSSSCALCLEVLSCGSCNMQQMSEAANVLMDIFCDEEFDSEVYVPRNVHPTLKGFLPALRQYISTVPHRSWEREQCEEIAENLHQFIKYKLRNAFRR